MPISKYITLTVDEFGEQFTTVRNHLDDNAGWNGCFFETFGEEIKYVMRQDRARIWTIIDGDKGSQLLVSGFRIVNRINYLVTVEAVPTGVIYDVKMDELPPCEDE